MRLSCLPVSLFPELIAKKMSIGEWAEAGKKIGLDMVDLSILFFHSRTRREIQEAQRQLDAAGMPVGMITCYPDFADPNVEQRERELAHTYSDIAVASELGAEYLRITAGQRHPGCDREKTIEQVADCFQRCAEFAGQAGVKLVFENHAKPGAWDNFDFDFDTSVFLALSERVRGMNVKINFDTANTLGFGDDPVAVFGKICDLVETIHVADISGPGEMRYTEICEGKAPIKQVLGLAKKAGFDGLISIEEASMHGLDGIRRAALTTRKLWEAL